MARIALVDMDGTLADFVGGLNHGLEKLRSPGEPPIVASGNDDGDPDWLRARKRLIKSQPGFWRGLHPLEPGFEILWLLQRLNFEIHILTKGPANNPIAWSEKLEWVRAHLSDTPITITSDKGLVYGKVLVDDYPPYVEAWLAHRPRGRVIMPWQPWNQDYEHPQVLRYSRGMRTTVEWEEILTQR